MEISMNIKKKILGITIAPVIILGLISMFLTTTMVRSAMLEEIEEALRGTAAATLAAYDQNTGDYLQTSNGDIWKGSYNISKSESLVDRHGCHIFLRRHPHYDVGGRCRREPYLEFQGR